MITSAILFLRADMNCEDGKSYVKTEMHMKAIGGLFYG